MNRNISMLIVLALVVGTVLIAYNKWIMRDAYTISDSASSAMAVTASTHESQALQTLVLEKSTAGTRKASESGKRVQHTTSGTSKIAQSEAASEVVAVTRGTAKAQRTVTKKVVTVAEAKPKKTSAVTAKRNSPKADSSVTAKKKVQLAPLASVSYSKEKLTVYADSKFTYKIFGLTDPDRFVVDVVGRFSEDLPEPKVVQDALVKTVRLGRHEDRVRIVLDLKGKLPPNWSASQKSGTLSVVMK